MIPIFQNLKAWLFSKGVVRRNLTMLQAVALIVGSTIGAGILGMPYVISKSGLLIGVAFIVGLGLLTMGINLLLGEVSTGTVRDMQLVGIARKHLGQRGALIMMALFYTQLFAILTIYIIGEGELLASLLGGSPLNWSLAFWALASLIVYIGLQAIKNAEVLLTSMIVLVIAVIAMLSLPHINIGEYSTVRWENFLLPYGVVLFAFSGLGTIPAAYRLLRGQNQVFKRAIIFSSGTSILVYITFVTLVIGVTGAATTEIATIGLGDVIGPGMFITANVFAMLAMFTSYLMLALELKDSLNFDFGISYRKAALFAMGVPLFIYLAGLRRFIVAIDLVGGVLMSAQIVLILLIYRKARQTEKEGGERFVRNAMIIVILGIAAFACGALYSVYNILN